MLTVKRSSGEITLSFSPKNGSISATVSKVAVVGEEPAGFARAISIRPINLLQPGTSASRPLSSSLIYKTEPRKVTQ